MNINGINLGDLTLPGRAGELQAAGATAAFVREVGDNYAHYNRFLAGELKRLGGDPRPQDYRRDQYDEYLRDHTRLRDIVAAEQLLRRARAHRVEGKPLDAGPDMSTPLADSAERLLSVETGRPAIEYAGSRPPRGASAPDFAPR